MSDDPWISSHLELRGEGGEILSGYGWIFPLGNGEVNIGVGTLATAKRPANVAIKPLMKFYADERRDEFELSGDLRMPTSALLPMGGAVSNVAGPNWALIGDAAACVNPLNGEGIDYGLETGRLVADMMADESDLATAWPALLREHYGESFSIARRLAGLVTVPRLLPALGPAGMRSDWLMTLALRWMGNLVTDEDRDRAARVWRWAGRRSLARDHGRRSREPARPGGVVPARDRHRPRSHGRARPHHPRRGSGEPPAHRPGDPGLQPQRLPRLPADRGGRPEARPVRAVHVPPRRLEQVVVRLPDDADAAHPGRPARPRRAPT